MSTADNDAKPPPSDREPLPRDAWYVAAASTELGDTPLARTLHGMPVVIFRGEGGAPAALWDRCPHRGVALSLGRVEAGAIACAYHGWRFGADGACVHIPSLAAGREIAAGVGVRRFPCVEQDGYVWAWTGEGAPETATPPAIPRFADRVWVQGALDLACEAMLPIENNLDLTHAIFTHPGVHPQWFMVERLGFRDLAYVLTPTATGLEVTAGEAGRGLRLAFDLPDRVTVEGGPAVPVIVLHHTPTTPGRCRQHWLVSLQPATPAKPHAVRWTDEPQPIFEQDRRVMESAEFGYAAEGGGFERSVEADAPTIMARRIVRMATAGRWPADGRGLVQRRLIVRS